MSAVGWPFGSVCETNRRCICGIQVTVEEGNVQTLLPAACLLQLAEIQEACCEFLKRQLDPSNCLGIRAFADTHSCRELLRIADKFTQHNFQEVKGKKCNNNMSWY